MSEPTEETIEAIRARHAAIVPGPWRWEINRKTKRVQLCGGVPRFDLTVMDFVRYGLNSAAPRFQIEHRPNLNIMHRAEEFAVAQPGREHHADWFALIDQPDARFIESAPNDVRVLLAEIDRLRDELASTRVLTAPTDR